MALYDIKEFLTLDDVAEYLTDKCNYEFNLEHSVDQNRLIETIIQLVRNDKLHPVFYYSGSMDFLEKKVITRKSGRLVNHEIVSTDIAYDMSRSGHYFVNDKTFNKLIENNYSNYINIIDCIVEPYRVEGKQEIFENNILDYREIKDDLSIIFHDLLYPKLDLAKLFNQTEVKVDTEVIEKLREQVANLEKQLEQAHTDNDLLRKKLDDHKELQPNSQVEIDELKEKLNNKADAPANIEVIKGIAKLNIEKPIFISSAKAIADYLWSLDKSEAIRTGDMVQQIKLIMNNVNYDLLPDEDETIRTWLAEVAPPHAKKSGRTPKNAPSEITLTMKK